MFDERTVNAYRTITAPSDLKEKVLAQQKSADELCRTAALGALIHSLAGDRAAEKLGEYSVMASDIIEAISVVLK